MFPYGWWWQYGLKSNCAKISTYWIGLINKAHYIYILYRFNETSYFSLSSVPTITQHASGNMNAFLGWIGLDCVELDFGLDFWLEFRLEFRLCIGPHLFPILIRFNENVIRLLYLKNSCMHWNFKKKNYTWTIYNSLLTSFHLIVIFLLSVDLYF